MSTENGLPRLGKARLHTERLRERRDFLVARIAERSALGLLTSWEEAEVAALGWALPLMEAEWDSIRRLQLEVIPADRRAHPNEHDRRALDE